MEEKSNRKQNNQLPPWVQTLADEELYGTADALGASNPTLSRRISCVTFVQIKDRFLHPGKWIVSFSLQSSTIIYPPLEKNKVIFQEKNSEL
jgi:hypothetical protein